MPEDEKAPWKASTDDGRGVEVLEGEVDFSNSLEIRDWLKSRCEATAGEFLLDLKGLTYIDSSGLAVLIEVRKHLKAAGRSIRIVNVSPQVQKLFALTQIGELFGI